MKFPLSTQTYALRAASRTSVVPRPALSSFRPALPARAFVTGRQNFAEKSTHTGPGWKGRGGEDHALNRDGNDVQSDASRDARQSKAEGKEGSDAVSESDERNANAKAKEDHPEAPGVVIGMNSERGGKGA